MAIKSLSESKTATATNANAQVSITTGPEETILVTAIVASVSGGSARLVVNDGTSDVLEAEVVSGGPVIIPFDMPFALPKGADPTFTLSAAGSGNDGTVSVIYKKIDIS